MKKEVLAEKIRVKFLSELGRPLAGKLGPGRLKDVVSEIADYKEQFEWADTDHDVRRLEGIVSYLQPRLMMSIGTRRIRLSKKAEAELALALQATLESVFPSLRRKTPGSN
ncbi:MAG: hypothetical protein HY548_06800 [Elusimicrobia bacterium]|nr:hypothetical protein [Elusimicrobiota bacterium]